ncbi:MAG: hypothetical protein LBT19_00120 [Candidatus Nomurabacteria bacterium]|jgi:hypothetical protein|nr:hypothetical protein [Candidatus Nomurabacteria bacterium]
MIRIFYGDDRLETQDEIGHLLGDGYEVLDGESLNVGDLDSVFLGSSLFASQRKILVKDLSDNSDCFVRLANYSGTPHEVIVWESKLDKRTVAHKELVARKIEFREFKLAESPDKKLVFDIFNLAWSGNSAKAISVCEQIETNNDPYMFFGLMTSQAIKKLDLNQKKVTGVLKKMARADIDMKTTSLDSWLLIKSLLLQISEI